MSAESRKPETHSETITSWLPITTAWPSHSGCEQSYWMGSDNTILGWDPGYGASVDGEWRSCLPPAASDWWGGSGADSMTQVRLGPLVCPEAYYTATTSSKDAESTFLACCPSGYKFNSIVNAVRALGECTSDVSEGEVLTYAYQDESSNWALTTTSVHTPTAIAGIPLNGWNFAKATAKNDQIITATSSPALGSKSTSRPIGFPDTGLDSPGKAGIGVGITLGLIMLFGIAGYYFMARRRSWRHQVVPEPEAPLIYKDGSIEMEGSTSPPRPPPKDQRYEIRRGLERHPSF